MMLVRLSSGLNQTNFLVSLHTVPPLFACVGWDDATTTRQPIGKSVGGFELGVGCLTSWWGRVVVCARWKDQSSGCLTVLCVLKELEGRKKTHSVFDGDAPCPTCISRPNLLKW